MLLSFKLEGNHLREKRLYTASTSGTDCGTVDLDSLLVELRLVRLSLDGWVGGRSVGGDAVMLLFVDGQRGWAWRQLARAGFLLVLVAVAVLELVVVYDRFVFHVTL